LRPIFLLLFTTVVVYIAWQDDRVSSRAMCVMLALIVAFETAFR